MSKVKDIPVGTKYGSWTVLSFSHIQDNRAKSAYWNCKCVCGTEKAVSGTSLRRGQSTQCKSCRGREAAAETQLKYTHNSPHLYIVQCGEYVKIGSATDVKTRVAAIQSANPYEVSCLFIGEGLGHREKEMHDKLKNLHHRGEWFKASEELFFALREEEELFLHSERN